MRGWYNDQEATVRTIFGNTKWFNINKGVIQGCILFPYLLNLCSENTIRMADLEEIEHGVRKGGRIITNLRYVDDTTLLSETGEGLRMLLSRVHKESEKFGPRLNAKKTKIMITVGELKEFATAEETLEVVDSFNFLDTKIDRDGSCTSEIDSRIAIGKAAMNDLYRATKDRAISVLKKARLVKALVFPVLIYGCESWTVRKSERRKIDAFVQWYCQRLLRILSTGRRTNKSILDNIRPETSLKGVVVKRAHTFFRHTMRACGIKKDFMLVKIEGTRGRAREKTISIDALKGMNG